MTNWVRNKSCFYIPLLIFTVFSCGLDRRTDFEKLEFSVLRNSITNKVKLLNSKCIVLSLDYTHPRHCYFLFTGDSKNLMEFVESMKLYPRNTLKVDTIEKMNVYEGAWLWDNHGYQECDEDKIMRKSWHIDTIVKSQYAAYIQTGEPNKIYLDPKNKWNGKIIAILKKDTCVVFVEELFDPAAALAH